MKRIVIIGAGPAGLTTAYFLKRRLSSNLDVIILERDSINGGGVKLAATKIFLGI